MNEINDFSANITSQKTYQDWELTINGKEVSGEYFTYYDFWGDSDWDITIHNEDKLTDEEIDMVHDYVRDNITKF
jgi:hypothetical protein